MNTVKVSQPGANTVELGGQPRVPNVASLSAPVIQVSTDLRWFDYVTGFSLAPEVDAQILEGTVYLYRYASRPNLYRLVPDPYVTTSDAFYSSFDGTTLSGLVVARTDL
tara:strand:+ start:214 stop:540 length:327 start_codon:yes stop_codon:yes gene_type:complete